MLRRLKGQITHTKRERKRVRKVGVVRKRYGEMRRERAGGRVGRANPLHSNAIMVYI